MKWLIQNMYEGDRRLIEAVERNGMEAVSLSIKDLYTEDLSTSEPVCIHASTYGVQHLQNTYGFKTFAPFDRLRCQVYHTYWGSRLFNVDYLLMTLGEVIRNFGKIQRTFDSKELFVRPDTNDKIFNGGVYDKEDLERLLLADLSPETLCSVSPSYAIDAEWRIVMQGRQAVTGSMYRKDGELFQKEDMEPALFAESFEAYPGLPPVYVLDIALSAGRYWLLEVGAINCAGFYACDLDKIVQTMSLEAELMYANP